jgi:hypothetical protein
MAINFFHTNDDLIFHGDGETGAVFTFGECRNLTNDDDKIVRLKYRLKTYYIDALKEIHNPFVSSIMTCVGLEVLGQVFLGVNSDGETIESNTISMYQMLDPIMANPLANNFKTNYNTKRNQLGNNIDFTQSFPSYAHVVRKGLRNTFTHSYRSRGVYLDNDTTCLITINENEGTIIINPVLLKNQFLQIFTDLFDQTINSANPNYRQNLLLYWNILLM